MTRPGNYTIQVSRAVPKELGGGTVKSNVLTITVVEATPEPRAATNFLMWNPLASVANGIRIPLGYDLSRPGKYTISVARRFPPRQKLGEGRVTSNTITITVAK